MAESAKNINPSVSGNTVSLNTKSVNVHVPSDVLSNVGYYGGLSATIVGALSVGAGVAAKSGSPLIKAVFAIGTSAIATGLYALGSTINKRFVNNTKDIPKKDSDNPFSTSYIVGDRDNDLFVAQGAIDFLNTYLTLHSITLYLLLTLMAFFLGIIVSRDNTRIDWVKKLPYGNNIHPI